ncbi:hypothetical protein [Rhizobium azibense]|uniref:Uncharacterized protein n=1 Tax=Rhizobium azibense TaxID=1136135 RepID=A0A4R3RH20_9HYPH|nr:hypothetical protein [Rhizobium azibense]TCU33639.1 hypothetical protein EV129_115146 [Rhizobium azibense]
MIAGVDSVREEAATLPSARFVGYFVRRQGQYGTVAAVGRVEGDAIELIDEPKRLFPRDGFVETHGLAHHAGLYAGNWVEFDTTRNSRPRAAEYKVLHLKRIPRFAALPHGSDAFYRTLLTQQGWRGDKRPGLWALRLSEDRVIVVDLEADDEGALRISRREARCVRWCVYRQSRVATLGSSVGRDDVYLLDDDMASRGSFDWSDEADHVARVVKALSDVDDPRVSDLIAWLDLHHETGSGNVFVATPDHDAALNALRSGELADRLRADKALMRAYLDAALENDAVKAAVAEHARTGHYAEREQMRAALAGELEAEREIRTAEIAEETAQRKKAALEALANELGSRAAAERQRLEQDLRQAERVNVQRIDDLNKEHEHRHATLQAEIGEVQTMLARKTAEFEESASELERVRSEVEAERAKVCEIHAEIDRLLSVADRLEEADRAIGDRPQLARAGSAPEIAFENSPPVSIRSKAEAIDRHVLLSKDGKDLMRRFLILLLSGEIPILHGPEAEEFLAIATALLCPGRSVLIQADPTLISVEDLWARPGSGARTVLGAAAREAAEGPAVLAAILGVERSGARFWIPGLADLRRRGRLPRGFLACAVSDDADHEEIAALPPDLPWLEIGGAISDGAHLAAAILAPAVLEASSLDPGAAPCDFSRSAGLMLDLGFRPGLTFALRAARMLAEAESVVGDEADAKELVADMARSIWNRRRKRRELEQ